MREKCKEGSSNTGIMLREKEAAEKIIEMKLNSNNEAKAALKKLEDSIFKGISNN